MVAGDESLNSYKAAIIFKIVASVPPIILNIRQIFLSYRGKAYYEALGFLAVTFLYCLCVWTLGGGGR